MRIIRITAALAALVAGSAHLRLYFDGYRDIPVGNIGTQFVLNAVGAVLVAGTLFAPLVVRGKSRWIDWVGPVAGVGWGAVSLVAFFVARTSTGWFGFTDQPGLNPAPEAQLSVFPEIIVVVGCVVLLAQAVQRRHAE